jgi:hypothetical protein
MTRDQDIERVLDQWLAEGPTQMPGRFLDDTLDHIDRAPHRRLAGLRWRLLAINPNLRLAAAAAATLLIAGIGLSALAGAIKTDVRPSPTPTIVPVDRAALQARWDSVGRRKTGKYFHSDWLVTSQELILGQGSLVMPEFAGDVLNSASISGADRLVVRLGSGSDRPEWACHVGDEGTYGFKLSAGNAKLTLTLVSDACVTRAGILAGDWTRWPCSNPYSTCQAELQPGHHVSSFLNMDPNAPATPPAFLIGYSYTVPVGWSQLESQNALGRPNDPGTMAVSLTLDVAPHTQAPDCPDAEEHGVPNTVGAIADWLTRVPGLVTTTPTPITIDGYRGLMLDVSVAPTWRLTCQYTSGAERIVFTFTDRIVTADGNLIRDNLAGESHSRYILLDLGGGHNLLIEVGAPDKASWDDLVQAAMPIVNSFQFTR